MKIQILPDTVINQIAAGEVVENPASVIKELLENAIDAGAKKIQIVIRGGGFQLIQIADDGEGMAADDALLCLERHGTSKIRLEKDLHALRSMGFRGEALASICSISKLRLVTSNGMQATEILAEGGKILRSSAAAREQGTTFEVRSLFYNTPARKQFQKSATSSQSEITRMVTRLALVHPEIYFSLVAGEKKILDLRPSDLRVRVETLLGKEFLDGARQLEAGELTGFLGAPIQARHNRSGQYLFINNRLVQCLPVSWAVEEGYGTRLPSRRYPTFVLFLEIPPEELDVNVHPQKLQVRLAFEERVRGQVQRIVVESFAPKQSVVQPVAPPVQAKLDLPVAFPTRLKESPEALLFEMPLVTAIGQFGRYYFAKKEEQLYLFDLPAALALICFEEAMERKGGASHVQMLLPQRMEFTPHEAEKIAQNISIFEEMGIGIRAFGESSFLVDSLSSRIEEGQVRQILEEWLGEKRVSVNLQERVASKIASAAKRKKQFSRAEAQEIAETVLRKYSESLARGGRPVYQILDEADLEGIITNQKFSKSAL